MTHYEAAAFLRLAVLALAPILGLFRDTCVYQFVSGFFELSFPSKYAIASSRTIGKRGGGFFGGREKVAENDGIAAEWAQTNKTLAL